MRKVIPFVMSILLGLPVAALAGAYPEKPIQMVVPYNPGGGSDISARIISDRLKSILPQPVVVTNINGAAGGLGAMNVKRARADGYTLLWEHPTMSITPLVTKTDYDWEGFEPVCMVASSPTALVVRGDSPFKSAPEAFAAIKSEPGKYRWPMALNGVSQFTFLYIQDATGIEPMAVPAVSDKARILSLLGGNGEITTVTYSSAVPYEKSGDLRILAMVAKERSPFAPDLPTLKEQGIDASYDFRYSVFAPKGTPAEVIKVLNDAFKKVMADPATEKALMEQSITSFYRDTPEMVRVWEAEDALNRKVAEKHGLLIK